MELKHIWSEQDWEQSDFDYKASDIHEAITQKSHSQIEELLKIQRRGFYQAVFFLFFFSSLYIFQPTISFLLPLGIIATCFIILSVYLGYKLYYFRKPDMTENTAKAIQNSLEFVREINRTQKRLLVVLLPLSTIGGGIMGAMLMGDSLREILTDPYFLTAIPIFAVLTSLYGYRISKWISKRKCKGLMNELEKNLEILEQGGGRLDNEL